MDGAGTSRRPPRTATASRRGTCVESPSARAALHPPGPVPVPPTTSPAKTARRWGSHAEPGRPREYSPRRIRRRSPARISRDSAWATASGEPSKSSGRQKRSRETKELACGPRSPHSSCSWSTQYRFCRQGATRSLLIDPRSIELYVTRRTGRSVELTSFAKSPGHRSGPTGVARRRDECWQNCRTSPHRSTHNWVVGRSQSAPATIETLVGGLVHRAQAADLAVSCSGRGRRLGFLGAFTRDLLSLALCSTMQGSAAHATCTLVFRGRDYGRGGDAWGFTGRALCICSTQPQSTSVPTHATVRTRFESRHLHKGRRALHGFAWKSLRRVRLLRETKAVHRRWTDPARPLASRQNGFSWILQGADASIDS